MWKVEVQLRAFVSSVLEESDYSASRPGLYTPRHRAPFTHRIGGWMGPEVGLDTLVKRNIPASSRN